MRKPRTIPVALTIAGSDSGGGAGIQADLKTFASLGVHGASAITCVTAQNPRDVRAIQSCKTEIVLAQIEAVFEELHPTAVKTGMLYSAELIRAIASCLKRRRRPPLIVDPVMVATSGARLLQPSAVKILRRELLPLAALVTPNVDEAEVLIGRKIRSVEDLRAAARDLRSRYGCAALVKGGHLRGLREAVDIFCDGEGELLLTAPFIPGVRLHGTGCVYSAAIAAFLARGDTLRRAVASAKRFISRAIGQRQMVGRYPVLNLFPHRGRSAVRRASRPGADSENILSEFSQIGV